MICQDNYAYAKYEVLPDLSYNIISYLMKSPDAEIIWKLLKDNSNDAWTIENLTQSEKGALIYDGSSFATGYRVFMDTGMDDAITEEATFLRIYPYYITPISRTTGVVDIAFEIVSHYKTNTLSNYKTRVDTILQALIKSLNGVDIGGLGVLFFDANSARGDKVQSYSITPYRGKILVMSLNVG